LGALFASWGFPAYRGRQVFEWLHARGAEDFADITVLPAPLRAEAAARLSPTTFRALARQTDPGDGTVKYLFELADGFTVETVLMRYRYGYTACVSSQVGCRMGCRFCASTLGGLKRNLLAGEMAEQVDYLNRDLAAHGGDPAAFPAPVRPRDAEDAGAAGAASLFARVSRIVVMGMGEPLENLDAVTSFLRVAHEPAGAGIGMRHMTVSTSGMVPGIDRLAELDWPVTLAVSLHAPNDALRDALVPLNRRYPLAELIPACRRYALRTGRRLTFEYVLIGGCNDLPEHARELGRLLRGLPCHVNLIPLNPVPEWNLRPSTGEATARFRGLVRGAGLPVTLRRQLGTAIDAACWQLRRRALGIGPEGAPSGP
jgi:23S rRNA (adenine2503-C2)-methyltransferase